MLENLGINTNLAPSVDLIYDYNPIIAGLNRSFSADEKQVSLYAKEFIKAHRKYEIFTAIKHFPGHGSSLEDSHNGFVDISKTWSEIELEPYIELIHSGDADMIMTAHVFNSNLDELYPSTLSYKANTELLRDKLGYKGVIVSDDLQMGAIAKHYTLEQIVTLSINSGVDMLLFGNQLSYQNSDELVETILAQVKNGAIPLSRILESNSRVEQLFTKIKIK